MVDNRGWYPLPAAETSGDELPGVAPVDLRTLWTHGRSSLSTGFDEDAVGLIRSGEDAQDLAGAVLDGGR